jgi:hypothetical protein
MARKVVQAEEPAERRLRVTAPITPGSRSKTPRRESTFRQRPRGKYVDAAEVRVVAAAVPAAAADADLIANYLPKRSARLVTERPVEEAAWRQEARGRKMLEGGGSRRCRSRL